MLCSIMAKVQFRSGRQLMDVVDDRLSFRWYVGYDLCEPLTDYSRLKALYGRLLSKLQP